MIPAADSVSRSFELNFFLQLLTSITLPPASQIYLMVKIALETDCELRLISSFNKIAPSNLTMTTFAASSSLGISLSVCTYGSASDSPSLQ